MNPVATTLARRIPILGGLLFVTAAVGLLLLPRTPRSPNHAADASYAGLLLVLGVLCGFRRRALEEPGKCRFLLGCAIAMHFGAQLVRVFGVDQRFQFLWFLSAMPGFVFYLGVTGMLGGTLALRDDPDNDSAGRTRRRAALVTFFGFGLLLLSELLRVLAFRGGMSSVAAGASVFTLFVVLVRGCLATAAVLVCMKPAEGDAVFRREAVIFKALVASVGFNILGWLAFVVVVVFQLMPNMRDSGRYLWLGAAAILISLLSIALVPVAVRKPDSGYNSATGNNSSGGAEA